MTPLRNQLASADEHLWSLTQSMCDGTITEEERDRLEALLRASDRARLFYAAYVDLHGRMLWRFRGGKGDAPAAGARQEAVAPPAGPLMSNLLVGLPTSSLHGTFGILSSGWPVAYLVATAIFGIGLLIGTFTYVSRPLPVAGHSPAASSPHAVAAPQADSVGQITAMVDCKWVSGLPSPASGGHHEVVGAGGESSLQLRSPVRLHNRFALASGLLEITYDTGARIILQGPVKYEIESRSGGFLSTGKLTATVEAVKAKGFSVRTADRRRDRPWYRVWRRSRWAWRHAIARLPWHDLRAGGADRRATAGEGKGRPRQSVGPRRCRRQCGCDNRCDHGAVASCAIASPATTQGAGSGRRGGRWRWLLRPPGSRHRCNVGPDHSGESSVPRIRRRPERRRRVPSRGRSPVCRWRVRARRPQRARANGLRRTRVRRIRRRPFRNVRLYSASSVVVGTRRAAIRRIEAPRRHAPAISPRWTGSTTPPPAMPDYFCTRTRA